MKNLLFTVSLLTFTLVFSACSQEQTDMETTESSTQEDIVLPDNSFEISDAWARPARENGVTAVYLNVLNGTDQADTLLALSSTASGLVELHETYDRGDGMMGMREAEDPTFPANDAVQMVPGGKHIMLMQLNRELKEGDTVDLTLEFATAGEITLTAPVRAPQQR
jgi:copper(I)-binding protein